MRRLNVKHLLFLGLCMPFFIGCETDDPDPGPGENHIIFVTEAITTPTTWYEGNIYIVDINGDFRIEALLTIEQDVIVKNLDNNGRILVHEGGAIQAIGTADKPIIFTSQFDDMHGGDNTGDGPTLPAPEDWGNIELTEVSGSVFSHCHFFYGGGRLYTTIDVVRSTVDINNCLFAYNVGGEHTEFMGVVHLDNAFQGTSFTNNILYSNVLPLTINAELSMDDSNQFSDPDHPETGNVMNGIFTNSYAVTGDVIWSETEVPFVVANDFHLTIEDTGSLTLADNVVLKITGGTNIDLDYRDNAITNYDGPGVYFTSFLDDSLKGDTNGDGSSTSPTDGNWEGIITTHTPITYAAWSNILYDEIHD